MPTPLQTLVSAAANLAPSAYRPPPPIPAPEPSFTRTLSEKRRPDPQRETPPSATGAPDPPPARDDDGPEPSRDIGTAGDSSDGRTADRAAPSPDDDAQGLPNSTDRPDKGDEQPSTNSTASSTGSQPTADAAAGNGTMVSVDGQGGVQPSDVSASMSQAVGTAPPAAAPTQPSGTEGRQQGPLPPPGDGALLQASPVQTSDSGGGAEQPRSDGRPAGGRAAPMDLSQLQPRAEQAAQKIAAEGNVQTAHDPALGRAVQVQAAVQVENMTGQAPVGQTLPTAVTQAATTGAAVEGQSVPTPFSPPEGEASRNIGRVVRGLSAMVNQRGGMLTMRLQPPDLGQLRVQMTIARGVVTAQFHTTTPDAQALLTRSMASLRSALESHGLTVERLSVQSAQPANGPATRESAEEQNQQQPNRNHADAGEGRSRGRHDGQDDSSPRYYTRPSQPEFEMPQVATAAAGADVS
jgi:hypothetical protein